MCCSLPPPCCVCLWCGVMWCNAPPLPTIPAPVLYPPPRGMDCAPLGLCEAIAVVSFVSPPPRLWNTPPSVCIATQLVGWLLIFGFVGCLLVGCRGGATTNGLDATHPPTIFQNSGGGGGAAGGRGGGSCRGSGGGFLPGVRGGCSCRGSGGGSGRGVRGASSQGRGGGVRVRVKGRVRVSPRVTVRG